MKLSTKINARVIHPLMIKYVVNAYRKKMRAIKKRRPDLYKPCSAKATKKHIELWSGLGVKPTDLWLRFLSNLSHIEDYRYCPEDIFYSRIERVLNECNRSGFDCEDKNLLDLYVPQELTPRTIVRYARGVFFDVDYQPISDKCVKDILSHNSGALIGKACVNSLGGHGISLFEYKKGKYWVNDDTELSVDWIKRVAHSYIIQEKVQQCDFCAMFNPQSVNSCKVVTLRKPWNSEVVVLKVGMRFGVTSAVIDNLSSGGICVDVDRNAHLSRCAYNWYKADEFPVHPVSKIPFSGQIHPYYKEITELAKKLSARNLNNHMLSWDIVPDISGNIKVLEVNTSSQSSDWLQFDFGGLFGEDSERLVEWCRENQAFDSFTHLRTWY